MPFCANCGAQVEGKFCAKCGAAVGVPGSAPAADPIAPTGLADNVASALCYSVGLITGILFLVLTPYNQNKTVRFHAFQSIFLHVSFIVLWMVFAMVAGGMFFIMHVGLILSPLLWLAGFVLWIYMIYSAYTGKKVVLPLIGPLAEKQA